MKVKYKYKGIDYVLTNDNLKVGDFVYPIGRGFCSTAEKEFIFDSIFDFRYHTSGFPTSPHTIKNLHHSDYKPYEVQTDMGYGPIETYFQVIVSMDPARYEITEFTTRNFVHSKKVETILVRDTHTGAIVLSIIDNKISQHFLLKKWKFFPKEDIEKIKAYFALPYPGIIKPHSYNLKTVLAHEGPRTR